MRGVREAVAIDGALIASADARKLDRMADELQATYLKAGTLVRKDETREVRSPTQLLDRHLRMGPQGPGPAALQGSRRNERRSSSGKRRWTTTRARLLQVKVQHADDADDLFAKLMGEVVEPRREFIQDNALYAALDV